MARIKNKQKYPLDKIISGDDYLIGTDSQSSNGETMNYALKDIAEYIALFVQSGGVNPVIKTSDLVNDGEDGLHPFITEQELVNKITQTLQTITVPSKTSDLVNNGHNGNEPYITESDVLQLINQAVTSTTGYDDYTLKLINRDLILYLSGTPKSTVSLQPIIDAVLQQSGSKTHTSQLTNDGDGTSKYITLNNLNNELANYDYTATLSGNNLQLLKNNTVKSTVDLSKFLDNTNLSRIETGSYDDSQKKLKLIRDDLSEVAIPIDLSSHFLEKGTYNGTAEDLKNEIDSKAGINHKHTVADITDFTDKARIESGVYDNSQKQLKLIRDDSTEVNIPININTNDEPKILKYEGGSLHIYDNLEYANSDLYMTGNQKNATVMVSGRTTYRIEFTQVFVPKDRFYQVTFVKTTPSADITFLSGNVILTRVDGTDELNGGIGSTATLIVVGTKAYLRISNV